jgi:hypothetical protein
MLFDEVTSALDPELVGEVLGVMRRLADERRLPGADCERLSAAARDLLGEWHQHGWLVGCAE